MRFSVILLELSTASLVTAGCFSHGDEWGAEVPIAREALKKFCNEGQLSGSFTHNQFKLACVNLSSVKRADFRVQAGPLDELSADSITLKPEECIKVLEYEIGGCSMGGSSTYHYDGVGDFTFV